jgi:hypothetical protein
MNKAIVAIVSTERNKISGGAPIFFVDSLEEQQTTAFMLEKILDATAHDLKDGTMILVKHG